MVHREGWWGQREDGTGRIMQMLSTAPSQRTHTCDILSGLLSVAPVGSEPLKRSKEMNKQEVGGALSRAPVSSIAQFTWHKQKSSHRSHRPEHRHSASSPGIINASLVILMLRHQETVREFYWLSFSSTSYDETTPQRVRK